MNMKKMLALVLALVMVLAMAACGGDSTTATEAPAANNEAPAANNEATVADEATPAEGGTLKLVLSTNDGSTTDDKIPTPWLNHNMPTNLMFRALLTADASLTSTSPDLAESVEVSEDGLTYVITLKEGLKWSDGEDLTVDDVIWSINAVMEATTKNTLYVSAFQNITEMVADGNTLTLTLSTPYSQMLDVLAQFSILPKHCLEGVAGDSLHSCDYWKNPVTNGYYMVGELNIGNYFTMVLNPYYEGTAPKIEKVTVSFVTDFLTAAQSGSADLLYGNASDLVEGMAALDNFTTYNVDVLFYKYIIFNMKGVDGNQNEAMQDVNVRKAIMTAIDRATLATLYPSAAVLNSGVPNSDVAYNGYVWEYDLEEAKTLLAESGYDMSRTLRICYYNNDQTSIDMINTIVYYLQQLGLTVEATLSNDGTTDLFTTRAYDIALKGLSSFSMNEWYAEYMSTSATFANIFGGETTFDAAVAALTSASTTEARNAALENLQALEQENVYKVPLFTVGNCYFVSDNVTMPEGVEFCNPLFMNDVDFENWTVG